MVRRKPDDEGDTLQAVISDVERARREALAHLKDAGLGTIDAAGLPRPPFISAMGPHALAQLLLAALGRGDHGDRDTNPVYALYQVALDYRCAADGYRALADDSIS